MLALEQVIPQPEYSLIDLEVMALKEETFNGHQIPSEPENIFWYKREMYSECSGKVGHLNIDNDALKVAILGKRTVFVGRYQEGAFVEKHTSVGNLICTGRTKEELNELIGSAQVLIAQQYMPKGGEYVLEEKGASLHKQMLAARIASSKYGRSPGADLKGDYDSGDTFRECDSSGTVSSKYSGSSDVGLGGETILDGVADAFKEHGSGVIFN